MLPLILKCGCTQLGFKEQCLRTSSHFPDNKLRLKHWDGQQPRLNSVDLKLSPDVQRFLDPATQMQWQQPRRWPPERQNTHEA